MIQAKQGTKKMTTCLSDEDLLVNAVARALLGLKYISFRNGDVVDASFFDRTTIHFELRSEESIKNVKVENGDLGYHDDGSVWKVKNIIRKYTRISDGINFDKKVIVITKTKQRWRQ